MLGPRAAGPANAAFRVSKMDESLTNLAKDTSTAPPLEKLLRAKPAALTDACYDAGGNRPAEPQNFSGGECNKLYPTFPPPRMIAGGPITNNLLKCRLKPIDATGCA